MQASVNWIGFFGCLLGLSACGGDDSDARPSVPVGCNAIGGAACVLPWPSSIYEVDDPDSPTGRRLDIPDDVLPANEKGVRPPASIWNASDGWSANIPLLMAFSTGFDPSNLPTADDPAQSLSDESPTVIVDLDTGERVPHFGEADLQAKSYVMAPNDEVALILRPMRRLVPGHRYAVGIKNSLKAFDGGPLPVAPGFRDLQKGRTSADVRLDRAARNYPQIFAALAAEGAAKDELVAAWDFTVRSDEPVYRDLLAGRDAMLDAIGDGSGFEIQIETDEATDAESEALRIVQGTFDVPNLLTADGGVGSVLNRDPDSNVTVNGTLQAPFAVVIPKCAEDPANLPLPVVIVGHGLIGSLRETTSEYFQHFTQQTCSAVVGTEWRGLSAADSTIIGATLTDVARVNQVMEKLVQGVNQFVALETLVRLVWTGRPEFELEGNPLFDPTRVYYYGSSQGGIMGATFMAIDPYIERGVLGVPAANFSFIIERSTNWNTYRKFIYDSYLNSALDTQILLTLLQMRWDLTDPITHVSHLTGEVAARYPNVPVKRVLLQVAAADSQVANIGTDLFARTAELPVLSPSIYTPYGVEEREGPLSSGISQWNEHREPAPPGGNLTPEDNGTHGSLRWRDRVIEQIQHFFENGEIVQTCMADGAEVACDCPNTPNDAVCGAPHF